MASHPSEPDSAADEQPPFRWQALFQQASEPLYVLNRRRRILFVNRAWEQFTGFTLKEVRGQICRRKPRGILAERLELLLGAMSPPPEVMQGQPGQSRRLWSFAGASNWWHVTFFPLSGGAEPLAIVGKIRVVPISAASAAQPLSEKMVALRQRHVQQFQMDHFVGQGPSMERVRAQVRLASHATVPVLLVGPPGTGKRWVARAIHHLSPNREQAFASLDCTLPAELLTRMIADLGAGGSIGSLYLKNVNRLPRELQDALGKRLETDETHTPRIFASLRESPEQAVRTGELLESLSCRLGTLPISLPPLKDRTEDLPEWIERLLPRARRAAGREVDRLSAEALSLLTLYEWPGNLSELYEVLVGACLRAKGNQIEAGELPFYLRNEPAPPLKPLALDKILEEVERRLIVQALRLAKNNKSQAAEYLTIWRARLLRRIETLQIKDS